MIQLLTITILTIGVVIGFYAIALLQQLRKKFAHAYLNSFFYYQILIWLFGLYGIIGNLILREILPKFGIKLAGIESFFLFFPLLGIPFLIAAWFLQIKMAAELCNKKTTQHQAIFYFLFTTLAFLLYGFYVLKLPESEIFVLKEAKKNIFLGYGVVELIIQGYIVSYIILNAISFKSKTRRLFLIRFAGILVAIAVFKVVSLYFSNIHLAIGLYFILIYFAGLIPLIFLTKNQLEISFPKNNQNEINLFAQYSITPREKEIIIEICKGKTNQQIADSLFITLQTVKDHAYHIFQKTGVKNRVQLTQKFQNQ